MPCRSVVQVRGPGMVGKSSLVNAMSGKEFVAKLESTVGADLQVRVFHSVRFLPVQLLPHTVSSSIIRLRRFVQRATLRLHLNA